MSGYRRSEARRSRPQRARHGQLNHDSDKRRIGNIFGLGRSCPALPLSRVVPAKWRRIEHVEKLQRIGKCLMTILPTLDLPC